MGRSASFDRMAAAFLRPLIFSGLEAMEEMELMRHRASGSVQPAGAP
jgi:hypothetical protein